MTRAYLHANSKNGDKHNQGEELIIFIGFENHPDLLRTFTLHLLNKPLTWSQYYQRTLQIVEDTGVLPNWKDHPHEYYWLNNQRSRRSKLTDEQHQLLEALPGFTWDRKKRAKRLTWTQYYQKTLQIIVRTGEFPNFKDHPTEYDWVRKQRMKMKKNHLTLEQQKQLEALPGFTWDIKILRWQESYQKIVNIFKETGEQPNRKYHHSEYQWLKYQRKHRDHLTEKQRKDLETLPGFTWIKNKSGD